MTMHIFFNQDKDGYKKDSSCYVERSLARRFCENGIAIPYQTHLDNVYDAEQAGKEAAKAEKKNKAAEEKKAVLLKKKEAAKAEKKNKAAEEKKAVLLKKKEAAKVEKANSKKPKKAEKAVKK